MVAVLMFHNKRDIVGGGVIGSFGLVALLEGRHLGVGSLTSMGPGFVPQALGVLLVVLGLLMAAQPADGSEPQRILPATLQWRGWGCITLGMLSFLVLGPFAGLVPAAFSCVFIAALGDRTATIKASLLLATGVTVFGVGLFHYVLQIAIPLFWWSP